VEQRIHRDHGKIDTVRVDADGQGAVYSGLAPSFRLTHFGRTGTTPESSPPAKYAADFRAREQRTLRVVYIDGTTALVDPDEGAQRAADSRQPPVGDEPAPGRRRIRRRRRARHRELRGSGYVDAGHDALGSLTTKNAHAGWAATASREAGRSASAERCCAATPRGSRDDKGPSTILRARRR